MGRPVTGRALSDEVAADGEVVERVGDGEVGDELGAGGPGVTGPGDGEGQRARRPVGGPWGDGDPQVGLRPWGGGVGLGSRLAMNAASESTASTAPLRLAMRFVDC